MTYEFKDTIDFWFMEITPAQWWKKDKEFDFLVRERFLETHQAALAGELSDWRRTAEGRLAEIIILDQFSRNMFRDLPESFASDSVALVLAQEAVAANTLEKLPEQWRAFMIMPYMHSESKLVHEQAVDLFDKYAPANLDFELRHKKIIDRFGRYPHRNKILGRISTEEELEFLMEEGSSF